MSTCTFIHILTHYLSLFLLLGFSISKRYVSDSICSEQTCGQWLGRTVPLPDLYLQWPHHFLCEINWPCFDLPKIWSDVSLNITQKIRQCNPSVNMSIKSFDPSHLVLGKTNPESRPFTPRTLTSHLQYQSYRENRQGISRYLRISRMISLSQ